MLFRSVDMELAILLDPLIAHVMIVGEARPFLAALVVVDRDEWSKIASSDLPADPSGEGRERAEKFIAGRIAAQIKGFPGYAQVRRVAIVGEPWTVDNGLLTPTLKLRRQQILERFGDRLEEIYRVRG